MNRPRRFACPWGSPSSFAGDCISVSAPRDTKTRVLPSGTTRRACVVDDASNGMWLGNVAQVEAELRAGALAAIVGAGADAGPTHATFLRFGDSVAVCAVWMSIASP